MTPEEKDVKTTESELTEEDKKLFGNILYGEDDEEVTYGEADDEQEETQDEPPVDDTDAESDKRANWDVDDYKKAYENLEKLVGRQGQELGELRKYVQEKPADQPPEQKTVDDIPNMSVSELDNYISTYEQAVAEPNLLLEDEEKYNEYQSILRKLTQTRAEKGVLERLKHEQRMQVIHKSTEEFKKENSLTDDETQSIMTYAKRLSGGEEVGNADMEAAMLKLYPDKFYAQIAQKQKERIASAKSKTQPRLPSGNRTVPTGGVTVKQLAEMDDSEREAYLENASTEEVKRLYQEVNKK